MTINRIFSIILVLIFAFSCFVNAQNSSYQRKVIAGKTYILYPVEQGEGMYAVSRKFNVPVKELNELNSEAVNGLKAGQILLIPVKNETASSTTVQPTKQSDNQTSKEIKSSKPEFVLYTVEKKQTIFALCRKFDIKEDVLRSLNPELKNGLKTGMIIKVPVNSKLGKTTVEVKPEVVEEKPVAVNRMDNMQYLTKLTQAVKPNATPIKIAVLLPLVIENQKTDAINERFQEFYAGFLLAVNNAKNKGVSLEIFTFDTEKSEEKIQQVLQAPEFKNVDLIIGPAYSNQIPYVSDFARENKISTVIPFSPKVADIHSNPYIFQFNPSKKYELDYFEELIAQKYQGCNLIFVDLPQVSPGDDGNEFSSELKTNLKAHRILFKNLELSADVNFQNTEVFEVDKKNILIFNTDKFSNIFPYLSILNAKSKDYEVVLFEQFSWKNQQAQVKFKSFSIAPFKPDLNDTEYTAYKAIFDNHFNWKISSNNPRYDVLGYDLGNYFIAMLYEFGPQFSWGRTTLPFASGVQSFLKFERKTNLSGFVNVKLYQHEK